MYDKKSFKETFSILRASSGTLAEVLKRTTEQKKGRRISHWKWVAAFTAVMLTLTVTALAVSGAGEMFLTLFRQRSGSELTPDQQQLIDASCAGVGARVTDGGLTITVESVLSDDFTVMVKLNVEAPEGVALECDNYGFQKVSFYGNPSWETYRAYFNGYETSWGILEDHDGKSNTISLLFEGRVNMARGSGFSFRDGESRTFEIKNLETWTEEGRVPLFEGVWRFGLVYGSGKNSVELISEPVHTLGRRFTGRDPDPDDADDRAPELHDGDAGLADAPYEDVWMTSFQLSPLGATCFYEFWDDDGAPEALYFFWVELVMKDGHTVTLYPKGGTVGVAPHGKTVGSCTYRVEEADTIVALNEIDFVRLPGNVTLPMQEAPAS